MTASVLLLVSSLIALLLLVIHCLLRRGGRVAAAFFLPGIVFGIVRGNVIYGIMRLLSKTGQASRPYLPQGGLLPQIGHASIQVTIGWMFAGYLGWTVAEYILRRIGRDWERRLFPTVALSGFFLACISYCMESTAPRVGWWYWEMATANPIYGFVPVAGIVAWFSVATDFLLPVLLIACSEHRRRWWVWLSLLIFPVHITAHALFAALPMVHHVHLVMMVALIASALFNRTRIEIGLIPRRAEGDKPSFASLVVDRLPAIAIVAFLAVIVRADVLVVGDPALVFTVTPLVVLGLLAIPGLDVWIARVAAFAGVVGWKWVSYRALYGLVPPAVFGGLYAIVHGTRQRALRWGVMIAVVVGAVLFAVNEEWRYYAASKHKALLYEANKAERKRRKADAHRLRQQARRWEPSDPDLLFENVNEAYARFPQVFESRLKDVLADYERIKSMDPWWAAPRIQRLRIFLLKERLGEALEEARGLVEIQPLRARHRAVLGYLLLRTGDAAAAREQLQQALARDPDDLAGRINLATVTLLEGDRKGAEAMLDEVLAASPDHPVARANLRRIQKSLNPDLTGDITCLAAPESLKSLGEPLARAGARLAGPRHRDMSGGLNLMKQAVHYAPLNVTYRTDHATLFARNGRLEEAAEHYLQALRLKRDFVPAQEKLFAVLPTLIDRLKRSGRRNVARRLLADARELLPENARPRIDALAERLRH